MAAEAEAEQGKLITDLGAHPGFNNHTERVEITPQEKAIGLKTMRYYTRRLHRQLPWVIKNGQISIEKRDLSPTGLERSPGSPKLPDLRQRVILTDGLEKEQISDILAAVVADFKWVEDKLADFTGRASGVFRNIWGIQRSYLQWGHEEGQHSDAAGLILIRTGHASLEDIEEDYYKNLSQTWEPAYPTARQNVVYATFQEKMTSHTYDALSKRALAEDAPITSEIFKLIAHDEAYHGGGYRMFTEAFAEDDLQGTIDDIMLVAATFRMPAQNLLLNPRKALLDARRVGAFTRDLVAERTIYEVLKAFDFLPDHLARQAADNYWKNQG